MWNAIGTIFDGIASVMAISALIYSITSFKKSLVSSHYAELDSTYADLLKLALDKPYLYRPDTITDADKLEEYQLYAFMLWNFLEAIYDRCQKDHHLCSTWHPIVDDEGKRHLNWLQTPENRVRFKDDFLDFIQSRLGK
jgi:hypothetical protein